MADEDDFASLFEQSVAGKGPSGSRRLKAGETVDGSVIAIGEDTVFVDVGTKAEARIDRASLTDERGNLKVQLGQRIRATVIHPGGREAPVLSVALGRGTIDAAMLESAMEAGTPVEGEITKAVKAGLEVSVGGVRAFCPASQVEIGPSGELEGWVGQRHFFRVLEVKEGGRSVIVSRRALLQAERAERAGAALARLEVGAELDGIIASIQPYGVFVDLGGLEGLVHVSELGHGRVASPSDVVAVGEQVRVKVLAIDAGGNTKGGPRVSLSMKALLQPAASDTTAAPADVVVSGTVARIEGGGVFVDTPQGGGFVPNGELGLPPGSDPRRVYEIGQVIDVVVLRRDGSGKLRLSVKGVAEAEARRNYRDFRSGERLGNRSLGSLGDLLRDRLPDVPDRASEPTTPVGDTRKPSKRTDVGPERRRR